MLPNHLLERAHEDRDEAVNIAGVVAAGRLQDHQSSCKTETDEGGSRMAFLFYS